ncbi:MAG: iron chelate uptake ABC transporter family permease subunit [Rhodovibrionaceae bacterium]
MTAADGDAGAMPARRGPRRLPAKQGLIALGASMLVLALLSIGWGAVSVPLGEILSILASTLGLGGDSDVSIQHQAIVTAIRLPRVIACLAIGAALAVAGAAMQGLFRNPLADPGLVGVSNGAALAAVVAIVLGPALIGDLPAELRPYITALAAFGGGIVATWLVYRIGTRGGQTDVATMLLAGIALNAIGGAAMGGLVFISDDQQLRDLTFWMMGSLAGITWTPLLICLPLILLAIGAILFYAKALNALLLGEAEAFHLGIPVERAKTVLIAAVALAVGAAVAISGIIGFVGLVVPHILRLVIGPDHRWLIPGSALLGAVLLLLADNLARTVVVPAEVPIGVVTSLVGGPFFLWLLLRRRIGFGG